MKITNKDIIKDVNFIISEIKNTEIVIPSFLACAMPGLLIMIALPTWQYFVLSGYDIKVNTTGSLAFSIFVGFLITLSSSQIRGKYLSLPETVKEQSIIIKLLKKRVFLYGVSWVISNITFGVFSRTFLWSTPEFNISMFLLCSLIFTWFVTLADLGRYDLSLLSAAIQSWREGGDVNLPMSSQHHQQ